MSQFGSQAPATPGTTMRAAVVEEFGPPEVVCLRELPAPTPGPGHVSIDVAYASVGLVDVMFRRGDLPVPLPLIPGLEVAGTVREVGPGVVGLVPGQPVVTLSRPTAGGWADVAIADVDVTVELGSDVTPADLALAVAVLPNATCVALALREVAHLRPGERVLAHGVTGGLGAVVGQVAKLLGAGEVIGTVRRADARMRALALGFDAIVGCEEIVRKLGAPDERVDVVLDPVGGAVRRASLSVLRPLGRLLALGNASGEPDVGVGANDLWIANHGVLGFNVGGLLAAAPDLGQSAASEAAGWLAAGKLMIEHEIMPFSEVVAAGRRQEDGAVDAKIVLDLSA